MRLGGKKIKTAALIDIGSLSLGGAYVFVEKNRAPRVCYSTRVPLPVTDDASPQALLRILDSSLKSLTEKLEHEGSASLSRSCGVRNVDDVIVSVGSPWQRTMLRSHTETFSQGKRITTQDLEEAKKRIEGALGIDPVTAKLVDHSLIEVLVNGYQTTKPVGKRAGRMSVLGLASIIPLSVHDMLTTHLTRTFHKENIKIQSTSAIGYVVLRDLFSHEPDFLAAIVTGEATDLLLIKRGVLTGVATTLEGVNSVTRAMGTACASVPQEDIPELLETDTLHPHTVQAIRSAERGAKDMWARSVIESLADLARKHALPQTFFVLADLSCRSTFTDILKRQDVHSLRLGEQPFTILGLRARNLTDHVVFMGQSDRDIFHGLLALFYSKSVDW